MTIPANRIRFTPAVVDDDTKAVWPITVAPATIPKILSRLDVAPADPDCWQRFAVLGWTWSSSGAEVPGDGELAILTQLADRDVSRD